MFLIVGLGNYGREYERTYHNLGFLCADYFMSRHTFDAPKKKLDSLLYFGVAAGQKTLVIKPQTYMNNSGIAVRKVMDYYGVDIKKLIVISDDIDLPKGEIRFREKGSAGTHNGLKSIIYEIDSTEFMRIRIGIGPKIERYSLADYVLASFTSSDNELFNTAFDAASQKLVRIIDG